MGAQRAHVMRDEVLCAFDDPGEVADTQLLGFRKSGRKRQPCRVRERVRPTGSRFSEPWVEAATAQLLRGGEVEAEQIAVVVGHVDILTLAGMLLWHSVSSCLIPRGVIYSSIPSPGSRSSARVRSRASHDRLQGDLRSELVPAPATAAPAEPVEPLLGGPESLFGLDALPCELRASSDMGANGGSVDRFELFGGE